MGCAVSSTALQNARAQPRPSPHPLLPVAPPPFFLPGQVLSQAPSEITDCPCCFLFTSLLVLGLSFLCACLICRRHHARSACLVGCLARFLLPFPCAALIPGECPPPVACDVPCCNHPNSLLDVCDKPRAAGRASSAPTTATLYWHLKPCCAMARPICQPSMQLRRKQPCQQQVR